MSDLQNDRSQESASQHRHRARHLQQLGRNDDALLAYREALSLDPDNASLLRSLAHCQMQSKQEKDQARNTIKRSIELAPYDHSSHALQSLIFSNAEDPDQAVAPALEAITLAPEDPLGYAALSRAHLAAEAWTKAEEAAKQALALDPENTMAANALTHALFRQGKQTDNQVHLSGMLHRDPEDPYTHLSAGLAALQSNNHARAEDHSLTALRLDPDMDAARKCLLESFRARSPIYRTYLNLVFYLMRFTRGRRLQIVIGLLAAMWMLRATFSVFSQSAGTMVIAFYAVFVVWTHVAKAVGSLIVFADARARQAMHRKERLEALMVGGNIVLGSLLLGIGMILSHTPMTFSGMMLAGVSIPLALTFSNDHPIGYWLYAGLALVVLLGLAMVPFNAVMPLPDPLISSGIVAALLAFIAAPWLSIFRVLYR